MNVRKEHIRINTEINRLYNVLTDHCIIPINHPEYMERANRMLYVIGLLLNANYQELEQLHENLFKLGSAKFNNNLIKYSIALKNATDIIVEDRDGRNYLINLLRQLQIELRKNVGLLKTSENQELQMKTCLK